jgi:hypothetical protein
VFVLSVFVGQRRNVVHVSRFLRFGRRCAGHAAVGRNRRRRVPQFSKWAHNVRARPSFSFRPPKLIRILSYTVPGLNSSNTKADVE